MFYLVSLETQGSWLNSSASAGTVNLENRVPVRRRLSAYLFWRIGQKYSRVGSSGDPQRKGAQRARTAVSQAPDEDASERWGKRAKVFR